MNAGLFITRRPVSRVLYSFSKAAVAIIPLGRPLPDDSRNLPERSGAAMPCPVARTRRSYLVLLLAGLAMPLPLPAARCALTAPFHPYLAGARWFAFCGAIPKVTLGGRYPPPYCRGARTFLEGTGEPAPPATARPSGDRAFARSLPIKQCLKAADLQITPSAATGRR